MDDIIERIKMIKAMEFIARHINNDDVFEHWLMCGVADGDIPYGSLEITEADFERLGYYTNFNIFEELMDLFFRVMKYASKDGGFYCGDVLSKVGNFIDGPSLTVREFVNSLITCLVPIKINNLSGGLNNTVWMGDKYDIDECDYADSKIFTGDDGTICGIYSDHVTIWIDQ